MLGVPFPSAVSAARCADGGHFILSPEERAELLAQEPQAAPFVRRYMSGGDFINGQERYCLWLKDADPSLLRRCPRVMARVELVRQSRLASKAESTRRYAAYSPDLNPIKLMWSKVKQHLRAAVARTWEAWVSAMAAALARVTPQDAANWFAHCGYRFI